MRHRALPVAIALAMTTGPKGFNVIHFDQMKTWPPNQNPFLDQTN